MYLKKKAFVLQKTIISRVFFCLGAWLVIYPLLQCLLCWYTAHHKYKCMHIKSVTSKNAKEVCY